ncbi:hypothetical protein PAMC26577_13665 [Caballeronia sordidicola]|uniref:Uncharacterized protein n=1 Tax=Caballeronia sordidicola TaxID=196367 RepID=A0A242MV51_CABSO|nr:hypothetical protein PAMC26577_13665 [Caballeronia sordidicola]
MLVYCGRRGAWNAHDRLLPDWLLCPVIVIEGDEGDDGDY